MVSTVTWFISGSVLSSAFSQSMIWVATLAEVWAGAAGAVSNRLATLWVAGADGAPDAGLPADDADAAGRELGREVATCGWPPCSPLRMMPAMRSVAAAVEFGRVSVAVRLVESPCTLRKIAAMRSLLSTGAAGFGVVTLAATTWANLA